MDDIILGYKYADNIAMIQRIML